MRINVLSVLPQLFNTHLENLPFKRAVEKGALQTNIIDLRKYAVNSYGSVDDTPYGGGVGMILRIEPIYNALKDLSGRDPRPANYTQDEAVVLLTPRGQTYNQQLAVEFSRLSKLTLICGRYEGVDARVESNLTTHNISVGNYVLTGGELPALVVMESVARLLPGVLQKEEGVMNESFSDSYVKQYGKAIEFPQYTRPEEFEGMRVPEVLLSGDHKKIEEWRAAQ